jgi:hypothetical protein
MHPTTSYHLAQARIADLRQHAQRDTLARAARRDAASPARARRADVADPAPPRADRLRVRSSQMEIDHVHP